jgi:hypothetical protein
MSLALTTEPAANAVPAGLNSSHWQPVNLPEPMLTDTASTVSCVSGSSFCLAIADLNNVLTVMATADEGASWQSYTKLPADIVRAPSVSCPTTSVCWVVGEGATGAPDVAEHKRRPDLD